MKKTILTVALGLFVCPVWGQEDVSAQQNVTKETASALAPAAAEPKKPVLTQEELRERFEKRNKEIKKLAKAYRKAKSEEKKADIKARLAEIVSEATDESMAWSKERIASVRANLDQWEITLQQQQANLEQIKAQRVEDILSGEAERRHKLAQKRWKQEMKDRKKYMK